ncbi:hypothetical protein [Arcicella lustrica]|uniref:Uncharacterized protein n=1 Tax=Arcicella lustrica TaxID=2984196 RepID=A0ABU5SMG7_9BACT|nr:hypothetical protein [Arcicella sp. DC25W]MEA5428510.1 hypothetical protein [Arcicella sp. DC25W]
MMTVNQKPFSNIQMELLNLYAMDIEEEDLLKIKNYLAQFFMQKAIDEADKIWEENTYSDELMDKWLNEDK